MDSLRFNTKTALIVTFWVAVFFATAALENRYSHYGPQSTLDKMRHMAFFFLFIISPAAVVGAVCNQPIVGILCGVAVFLAIAIGDTFLF